MLQEKSKSFFTIDLLADVMEANEEYYVAKITKLGEYTQLEIQSAREMADEPEENQPVQTDQPGTEQSNIINSAPIDLHVPEIDERPLQQGASVQEPLTAQADSQKNEEVKAISQSMQTATHVASTQKELESVAVTNGASAASTAGASSTSVAERVGDLVVSASPTAANVARNAVSFANIF